jgi:hypothetical protein
MSARTRRTTVLLTGAMLLLTTLGAAPASAAPRKPDGILKLVGGDWVGDDVYLQDAWETEQEVEVAGAGSYDFQYRIQNDGSRYDSIWVKADKWSTPPADCTYKVSLRGRNVTRKITLEGIVVKSLRPGDRTTFKVTIAAEGSDDQCALAFHAHSEKRFTAMDAVIATVANTA